MPPLETPQWTTDVERGPDWLFLRVHAPTGSTAHGKDLAEMIWQTMQQHFARRVVLELDDVNRLASPAIGQLMLLQKRICGNGGTLRVCGLNEANDQALRVTRLKGRLPCFRDRAEAVMGDRAKVAAE